jgi:hypothetical protein
MTEWGFTMSTHAAPPSRLSETDRRLAQPWFDVSGLDESSPQWAVAWTALVAACYASAGGLTLWPQDTEELLTGESKATKLVATALSAGALYAASDFESSAGDVELDAGLGVEVMLALLNKLPRCAGLTVETSVDTASAQLARAAHATVVGVFNDAPAALASLMSSLLKEVAPLEGWPPLVALLMEEAVRDDVFAENMIIKLSAGSFGIDYVVLESGNWLLFRSGPGDHAADCDCQAHLGTA